MQKSHFPNFLRAIILKGMEKHILRSCAVKHHCWLTSFFPLPKNPWFKLAVPIRNGLLHCQLRKSPTLSSLKLIVISNYLKWGNALLISEPSWAAWARYCKHQAKKSALGQPAAVLRWLPPALELPYGLEDLGFWECRWDEGNRSDEKRWFFGKGPTQLSESKCLTTAGPTRS